MTLIFVYTLNAVWRSIIYPALIGCKMSPSERQADWILFVPALYQSLQVKNLSKNGNLLQLAEGSLSLVYLHKHGTEGWLCIQKN